MAFLYCDLTTAERKELLEALRRDMRQQFQLAEANSDWAIWHTYNARTIKRILECLNPKTVIPGLQESRSGYASGQVPNRGPSISVVQEERELVTDEQQ